MARPVIPSPLADRLGPLLGRAHEAHRRGSAAALAPIGLTPRGFGALAVLVAEGPMSQRELAERQGIDRTTTVAVVDELERLGAVQRRPDAADRRVNAVHVTARGRRLLPRARDAVAAAEAAFLAPLPHAERARLMAALRALVEAAGRPPA